MSFPSGMDKVYPLYLIFDPPLPCLPDAFYRIVSEEGVATLWNSMLPSLILVFNPAVQFMFYEAMKRKAGKGGRAVRRERETISPWDPCLLSLFIF